MELVYTLESFPERVCKSIFLAGPTPRSNNVSSWRPEALRILKEKGFDGVVYVPESRDGNFGKQFTEKEYQEQLLWENQGLKTADCILFWVPRQMDTMPALTTNVEFGLYANFGKSILGAPENAENVRYLFAKAEEFSIPTFRTLEETVEAAISFIGSGEWREEGECDVPLHVWRSDSFQAWYKSFIRAGNRLDGAELLWVYRIGPQKLSIFAWVLRVKAWVGSESRHKSHDFVISRRDLSAVLLLRRHMNILDSEVVLVKEFRISARTPDGFIHELPGGSTFKKDVSPKEVAAAEVREETGLAFEPSRMHPHGSRQCFGTFSGHHAHLFSIDLTMEELKFYQKMATLGTTFGDGLGSEKTYIEVKTIRQILEERLVDWTTIGMISQVIF